MGIHRSLLSARPSAARTFAAGIVAAALLLPTDGQALNQYEIRCRDKLAAAARYGAALTLKARMECVRRRASGSIDYFTDCAADPPELGGIGTGDDRIDKKLARVATEMEVRGRALENFCISQTSTPSVFPADVLDPASACGSAGGWYVAADCAVDLGKQAADAVHARLDAWPFFTPLAEDSLQCLGSLAGAVQRSMFRLNIWRAKCFRTDDTLMDGGGLYECDANIAPPGSYNTTGWLKADKRLEFPMETIGVVLYEECDKNLEEIGLDLVTPDHSGGDFASRLTLDDVYDSINDIVVTEVSGLMAELFPVGGWCGDGNVDAGEDCDDGNNLSDDGCDRDCTLPSCPNGAIDGSSSPEECDDGNTADGDGCSAACEVERCGNGVANEGWAEECDSGGESAGCDLDCTIQACGDGYLNMTAGEQCDSGGSNDNAPDTCGDGMGPGVRGACQLPACQDGIVDTGETCDAAGETVGCDTNCTAASCGDGDLNPTRGETCDDGNASDADSCPSSNAAGSPWCLTATCGDGFACTDVATCTSGVLGGPETCDDGAVTATCDGDCTTAACGDGTLNALNVTPPARPTGEECDDGNLVSDDGCDGNCTLPRCGNGIVTPGEVCDDGNDINGDGCDDGAFNTCTVTACGNGVVTAGETCDGNGAGTGGETAACDTNCTASACGDGTLNVSAGEQCDDGDLMSGDGCDAGCQVE